MHERDGRSDGIRTHGLLVPNQARYHLRYTPIKNPQHVAAAVNWLGMRGSNSHGRSQSPLHYHYANPQQGFVSWPVWLPSTFIYYSGWTGICQHFFLKKSGFFFPGSRGLRRRSRKSTRVRKSYMPRWGCGDINSRISIDKPVSKGYSYNRMSVRQRLRRAAQAKDRRVTQ